MNVQGNATGEFSIVALDKFIQATRDSGYKGTSSAVAELVDNSLQAGATIIAVQLTVDGDDEHPIVLTLSDNGTGMDSRTLRTALRFGGSTRFNDRNGLGRYGMGLPNSSLSQAKRVTVHTWGSKKGRVLRSYLDIDEIVRGDLIEVPKPTRVCRPAFVNGCDSGTVVTWTRCDRLDNQRISTITRKLLHSLGRRFRYFLWEGASITVNGDSVMPIDPLFLHPSAIYSGATQFAEDIVYEVAADPAVPSKTGLVRVRFAELPAGEWSKLTNEEKRAGGIVKGAGVSIVRAGREVDYGWFFLGGKRRENYDDWWRCEIQFEPVLDEAFAITHTKQQFRPRPHLIEALSPDMESIARALNTRARKARYAPRPAVPHKLAPYTGIIEARLEEFPGLSAKRLFDEVRAAGYPGGYSRVRDYVRAVRPREPVEAVVRFETPPGRQGQVDFATFTLPWGRRHALVVVLSHSRLLWLRFYRRQTMAVLTRRQTMAVLTEGLERAFARFGGVPKELLFDQMRAVVLSDGRVGGGELVLNAEFLRVAAHLRRESTPTI